ncbi:MAG: deoxyribonuclease IV [Ruminococcus sp.]|nr:deoxyribonuclease IV [Ruminococcus sp.]
MLNIGCHLSVSNGFENMGKQAIELGGNTFQFFTRNPRGGKAKDINKKDTDALLILMENNNFSKILAHAPYTLNPCSANERARQFAFEAMADDLKRMEYIPNNMYNFHPGSHVGQGVDKGIELIAEVLNEVIREDMSTTILLETMAGKGSEIGSKFEELKAIIDRVELDDKLGVCLDTCHVFDAGYDIKDNLEGVLESFDKIIGLSRLKALHLNDSKNPLGSHKDRHEKIGKGYIGLEAFRNIVTHPALKELPCFLETPNELEGYAEEIALLKSF